MALGDTYNILETLMKFTRKIVRNHGSAIKSASYHDAQEC